MIKENLYENTIIVGEQDHVILSHYAYIDKEACNNINVKTLEYKSNCLPAHNREMNATTINVLYVINKLLERIKENKEQGIEPKSLYSITIPDKIYKTINRGLYKSWIRSTREDLTDSIKLETLEWKKFAILYKELFLDIMFKGTSYYSTNTEPKFNIEYMEITKNIIIKMKDKISKDKEDNIYKIIANA